MYPTPAVHVNRKTTHGPLDEDRALVQMLKSMRGITTPLPLTFGNKVLGWAVGESAWSPNVLYLPGQTDELRYASGFDTYAAMKAARDAGKTISTVWFRNIGATSLFSWYDWFCSGSQGAPAIGAYAGAANTSVRYDDTTLGSLYHGGNASPDYKFLTRMDVSAATSPSVIILYDRVLGYEANSFTANSSQAMTNSSSALRYNGASLPGLQICMIGQTATGATPSNLTTLTYVNNAGVSHTMPTNYTVVIRPSVTVTAANEVIAPCAAGVTNPIAPFLPLVAGDLGARSVTDYTTSAANTGTFAFILMYPVAAIYWPALSSLVSIDQVVQATSLNRIYDGACLGFLIHTVANNFQAGGNLEFVKG